MVVEVFVVPILWLGGVVGVLGGLRYLQEATGRLFVMVDTVTIPQEPEYHIEAEAGARAVVAQRCV